MKRSRLPLRQSLARAVRAASLLAVTALPGLAAAETLSDVLAAADASDPQWRAVKAGFEAQRQVLGQGRAGVLPSLVLSGEMLENEREQGPLSVDYDSTSIALQLTQPLLALDKWFTYQASRAQSSQAEAELVSAEQDYLIRVAETYFGVLRAGEQLAVARAEEAAYARQLEQAKQRFNVGLIAITDVNETQAAYDVARVNLIVAESDLMVARARLHTLTGKQYAQLAFPGDDLPVQAPAPNSADTWADKARQGNAALIAARHAARSAQQSARAATSAHLPTVDFIARRVESDSPASYIPPVTNVDSTTDSIGLQANWPLFAGGAINARRKQAAYQSDAATENLRAAEINAVEGARTQYRIVEADVLRVTARRQGVVSAQSALDATTAGYEVGTRNVVDVLQSQQLAFGARRDYANARYDYMLGLLRLHKAAGSLSRQHLNEASQWLSVTMVPEQVVMPLSGNMQATTAPAAAGEPAGNAAP